MGTVNIKNSKESPHNNYTTGIIFEVKSIRNKFTMASTVSSFIFGALILAKIFKSEVIFLNYYFNPLSLLVAFRSTKAILIQEAGEYMCAKVEFLANYNLIL